MSWTERLSAYLSRPASEIEPARSRNSRRMAIALFAGISLAILLVQGWALVRHVKRWADLELNVPIFRSKWLLLGKEGACAESGTENRGCPASPENPELWQSPLLRKETPARPWEIYWVGTTIPSSSMREAIAAGADHIHLGKLTRPYKIWLDGHMAAQGIGAAETRPIVLEVPKERMASEAPLHLAIRIDNRSSRGVRVPDRFATNGGIREGFLTLERVSLLYQALDFHDRVRPFALSLAFGVVALLFFFFWMPTPLKREYLAMALFCLACAFGQAHRTDFLSGILSPSINAGMGAATQLAFGIAGLGLSLAFARARNRILRGVTIAALGLPLLVLALSGGGAIWAVELVGRAQKLWLTPLCFALGAAACAIQAKTLHDRRKPGSPLPSRIKRLTGFAACMGAMAAFYLLLGHDLMPGSRYFWLFQGSEDFVFAIFLSWCALSDYGNQQLLISRTPVSPYHRRDQLPSSVRGALLLVDLKKSEALFRLGAELGDAGKLVDQCLSHLWSAATRNGGCVLQTDGDGLRALFDQDRCPEPVIAALRATDDMKRELRMLEEQLLNQGLLPHSMGGLNFRGGIALGEIRPVWQEIGDDRLAAWTEAGTTNTFVDAARIMDLERKVEHRISDTLVMMQESLARELGKSPFAPPPPKWSRRELVLQAKHGKEFVVAVYVPEVEAAIGSLRRVA